MGMPDKSARIATVKELQRAIAARNTNEMKNWPHLEAVAAFQKFFVAMDSAFEIEEKMFNNHL